jgi:hypothetical protein
VGHPSPRTGRGLSVREVSKSELDLLHSLCLGASQRFKDLHFNHPSQALTHYHEALVLKSHLQEEAEEREDQRGFLLLMRLQSPLMHYSTPMFTEMMDELPFLSRVAGKLSWRLK